MDPGFPTMGGGTGADYKGEGRQPINYLANFYWKLHENKKNWLDRHLSYAPPKSDSVQWFVFTFMQFSGKMAKMIGCPPPFMVDVPVWEILDPPLLHHFWGNLYCDLSRP